MKNFEKAYKETGGFPKESDQTDNRHLITPVNSSPKLTPINPTFQKSRISKSKRFNSTNARYKNVVNKMEKDIMNTKQVRKLSQGNYTYFALF